MVKSNRKLLRLPQARDYLSGVVKLNTLRQWIWRREIEVVRVGRSVCIPQDVLDRIIQEGTLPALQPNQRRRQLTAPRPQRRKTMKKR
jgi:excisionase family DNA binding protein